MLYFSLAFFQLYFIVSTPLLTKSEYLFSPRGNITTRIIEEVEKAEKEILIAVYMITSQKIIDALIKAHDRGISIKIVTDTGCINSPYGKIYHLLQADIPVKVFSPPGGNKKFPPLMHTKYALIDQKTSIIGSFNWTNSAEYYNEEHIRITQSKKLSQTLYERFQILFDERSTTTFTCHPNQVAAWNKKQIGKHKNIPSSHPTENNSGNNFFFLRQWITICEELSHLLWELLSNPSSLKTTLFFKKKLPIA